MKNCCMGHLKTEALVKALGLRKYEAIGILECLFQFAQSSAKEGNIGKYSNLQIALAMGWVDGDVDKGLDDADRLIDALLTCGFLDNDPDHRLIIHDWEEHRTTSKTICVKNAVVQNPSLSRIVRFCPNLSAIVRTSPRLSQLTYLTNLTNLTKMSFLFLKMLGMKELKRNGLT